VTLDGVAIEQGSITFRPTGGTQGPASGVAIANGQYRLSAADGPVVGHNRIEIYAPRKTGRKVPAPMGNPGEMSEEVVEMIPSRYNTQSTLNRDVAPGKNTLDFEAGVEYVDEKFTDDTKNDYFNGRAFTEYKYAFSDKATYHNPLEFNYDFENSENYDIASVTAVTTSLSDMLSLKASYNINFVNAPVPAILKKTDTTLSVSLIINM